MNGHDHNRNPDLGHGNGAPNGAEPGLPQNDRHEMDTRELLARYATGTLSESELARLHTAALDDQDLFDALADEHAIKELVELPGARQRLVAALTPEQAHGGAGIRAAGWRSALWPWAPLAGVVAAMALVTVWMLQPRLQDSTSDIVATQSVVLPSQAPAPEVSAPPNIEQPIGAPKANALAPKIDQLRARADVAPPAAYDRYGRRLFETKHQATGQQQGQQGQQAQQGQAARQQEAAQQGQAGQAVAGTTAGPVAPERQLNLSDQPQLPVLAVGAQPLDPRAAARAQLLPGTPPAPAPNVAAVNGIPNNTQVQLQRQDQAKGTGPAVDAVEEVAIQTANFAAEFGTAGGAVINQPPATAPRTAAPVAPPKTPAAEPASVQALEKAEIAVAGPANPAAPESAGRGGRGGAAAPVTAPNPPQGFAAGATATVGAAQLARTQGLFTQEFLPNGRLRIVPRVAGTLEVRAGINPQDALMFPRNPVVAGTPIEIPVPEGSTRVRIEFRIGNAEPVVETPPVPARGK